MKKIIIICMSVLFLIGNSDLYAQRQRGKDGGQMQQGQGPSGDRGNRPGSPRQAMQDLKKLERLRLMKLLDLLDLDTETESVLIPHIRAHQKSLFQIMKRLQTKIDKLGNGLKEKKFSDEEIIRRIKEIDKLEMERHEKVRAFHLQASEILTAEQLGKLYVFQARFGGEVLEKMGKFRKAQDEFRKRENKH